MGGAQLARERWEEGKMRGEVQRKRRMEKAQEACERKCRALGAVGRMERRREERGGEGYVARMLRWKERGM